MTQQQRDITDTFPGEETISLTVRLRVDIHEKLEARKAATGQSLNSQINKACDHAFAPPGGASAIAAQRRRLTPRGRQTEQAWAALAYVLGYLGRDREARRAWPWKGRFAVTQGDPRHLPLAGALIACEIDMNGDSR